MASKITYKDKNNINNKNKSQRQHSILDKE